MSSVVFSADKWKQKWIDQVCEGFDQCVTSDDDAIEGKQTELSGIVNRLSLSYKDDPWGAYEVLHLSSQNIEKKHGRENLYSFVSLLNDIFDMSEFMCADGVKRIGLLGVINASMVIQESEVNNPAYLNEEQRSKIEELLKTYEFIGPSARVQVVSDLLPTQLLYIEHPLRHHVLSEVALQSGYEEPEWNTALKPTQDIQPQDQVETGKNTRDEPVLVFRHIVFVAYSEHESDLTGEDAFITDGESGDGIEQLEAAFSSSMSEIIGAADAVFFSPSSYSQSIIESYSQAAFAEILFVIDRLKCTAGQGEKPPMYRILSGNSDPESPENELSGFYLAFYNSDSLELVDTIFINYPPNCSHEEFLGDQEFGIINELEEQYGCSEMDASLVAFRGSNVRLN